jgi:cell pole-organizing protein PopZ
MEKPDDVSALETTAHEPSGYTLDSFPSLPGDHDNALAGLSDRDAAPAAGPHGTAADAMPITPHETGHAEAGMNGAVATLPPEPMKSEPAPAGGPEPVRSYLSAVPSAVDAPPATATTAPSISVALDRDAQAAAAVALGALAAGLAAAPAGASPPQAAAPAAPPAAPSDAAPPPAAPPAVAPQAGTAAPVPAAQPSAAEAAPLPVPASQGQTRGLEDIIAEMARPMLERWISDNMPRIMEKALRGELKSKKP